MILAYALQVVPTSKRRWSSGETSPDSRAPLTLAIPCNLQDSAKHLLSYILEIAYAITAQVWGCVGILENGTSSF